MQTNRLSDEQLLLELSRIDKEICKNARIPSLMIRAQNAKLLLIRDSLIEVKETGCLELPSILEGKFKTFGYYGKKEPLSRVLYYFYYSSEDTIAFNMPEGNLFRSCANTNCFNPLHLVTAEENKRNRSLMRANKMIAIKVSKREERKVTEEEIEAELQKQEQELFLLNTAIETKDAGLKTEADIERELKEEEEKLFAEFIKND